MKDEFVSKSKSYRFSENSSDEDTAKTVYISDGKSNIFYRFYDKDKEQEGKYQLPYEEIANWKRTKLQLRDEVAHSFTLLMCETLEELGNLAFDLLSSSLGFVTDDKTQSNKSRWKTSRFWERFLGAVKAFLFLEKYNALGSLKDVQEMMNGAEYSVTLKQKLVSHLYRIDREELVPIVMDI